MFAYRQFSRTTLICFTGILPCSSLFAQKNDHSPRDMDDLRIAVNEILDKYDLPALGSPWGGIYLLALDRELVVYDLRGRQIASLSRGLIPAG